jgi:hypothetical protein
MGSISLDNYGGVHLTNSQGMGSISLDNQGGLHLTVEVKTSLIAE